MKIAIFDLDETVINSAHRTPNNPDGTLNLEAYIARHTPENVRKDKVLPLAETMRRLYNMGWQVFVLTARDMKACDYEFLARHNLPYHRIFSRDQAKPDHYRLSDGEYKRRWIQKLLNLRQYRGAYVIMFDDSSKVKSALRRFFPVLCAHKVNAKIGTVR